MKKILLTLCLFLAAQAGFAQGGEKLIDQFKNARGAEIQHSSKLLLGLMARANTSANTAGGCCAQQQMAEKIDTIIVLNLAKCDNGVKEKFLKTARNFASKDYEEVFRLKDSNESHRILVQQADGNATEILLLEGSMAAASITLVRGKIPMSCIKDWLHNK